MYSRHKKQTKFIDCYFFFLQELSFYVIADQPEVTASKMFDNFLLAPFSSRLKILACSNFSLIIVVNILLWQFDYVGCAD